VNYDQIFLRGLDLPTQIGVPDEERACWQTLQADVVMDVAPRFECMHDQLSATIDYAAVAIRLKALAVEKPRQLIETLASEMCACVLQEFNAVKVRVELRKKILPGCDHVAVALTRGRDKNPM
jgi:dihydroneopterin aldolase